MRKQCRQRGNPLSFICYLRKQTVADGLWLDTLNYEHQHQSELSGWDGCDSGTFLVANSLLETDRGLFVL